MGVPSLCQWLMGKYPKIAVETVDDGGTRNGIEFDNLYIDIMWVISRSYEAPDGKLASSDDEVLNNVLRNVDRLFGIVGPRKLLFLTMRGVSPRADINDSRQHHYLDGIEEEVVEEKRKQLEEKYRNQGKKLIPENQPRWIFHSRDTKVMFELSKALEDYVKTRIRDNLAWRNIKVIISDANVPGEPVQKVTSFIHSQRSSHGYNPNTRHCFVGSKCDLILQVLATHEVHFSILVVKDRPSSSSSKNDEFDDSSTVTQISTHLLFLHISVLREYLELDLQFPRVPGGDFKYDFERVIDDFIFMCFFLEDCFLPQIPTLRVEEGAIDLLMTVYKEEFSSLGGYLVNTQMLNHEDSSSSSSAAAAYIDLKRVERFILRVGSYEQQIFNKRHRVKQRNIRHKLSTIADILEERAQVQSGDESHVNLTSETEPDVLTKKQFNKELKRILNNRSEAFRIRSYCNNDRINFGLSGWKERYYKQKFSVTRFATFNAEIMETTRKAIVKGYAEGVCWLLHYYFTGVPSWTWFYRYHYAPCASDFKGLSQVKVEFDMGSPLLPFDELMAILHPSQASSLLPRAYANLMTDPCSEILHFYPTEFYVDFDGARNEYHGGICHIPFIDEELLLAATRKAAQQIDSSEAERNIVTANKLFLAASTRFGQSLIVATNGQVSTHERSSPSLTVQVTSLSEPSDAIAGSMQHIPSSNDFPDIVLCLDYDFPIQREIINRPITGVQFPERIVDESDIKRIVHKSDIQRNVHEYQIQDRLLWHEHDASVPPVLWNRNRQNRCQETDLIEDNPLQIIPPVAVGNITRGSFSNSSESTVNTVPSPQAYIPPHLRNRK